MADRLTALRVFQRVARRGNLSRAARDMGLSQPSVSRILAELEREIGVTLLVRSTRALTLTERGADYLLTIEPLLRALEEADHAARSTGELRGALRIGLSSSFGVREVIPRLPAFVQRHPALNIDLAIDDARQDLIADGIDVALRLGAMPDSNALARKLAEAPRLLAASPSYLAATATPATPAELTEHAVIVGPGVPPTGLRLRRNNKEIIVRLDGRLTVATNEGATAAAVAGLGINVCALWGCRAELASGALVRVLADWSMPPIELHAVFPPGRGASPAARSFIDYLAPHL